MSGKVREPLTVYQRIKRGANNGKRIILSPNDCFTLYKMDEAIRSRADQDDDDHLALIQSFQSDRGAE